jgi:hypothetical protein
MKSFLVPGVSLSVLLCAFTLQADVVKLKDGRAIQGIFLGGNTRQIDFLTLPSVVSRSLDCPARQAEAPRLRHPQRHRRAGRRF